MIFYKKTDCTTGFGSTQKDICPNFIKKYLLITRLGTKLYFEIELYEDFIQILAAMLKKRSRRLLIEK